MWHLLEEHLFIYLFYFHFHFHYLSLTLKIKKMSSNFALLSNTTKHHKALEQAVNSNVKQISRTLKGPDFEENQHFFFK
jgi:hypothetical protein